jgi:hypothetical protein
VELVEHEGSLWFNGDCTWEIRLGEDGEALFAGGVGEIFVDRDQHERSLPYRCDTCRSELKRVAGT